MVDQESPDIEESQDEDQVAVEDITEADDTEQDEDIDDESDEELDAESDEDLDDDLDEESEESDDDLDGDDLDDDDLDGDDDDFDLEEFDESRDDDIEPSVKDDEIEFHREPTPAELAKLERLAQLRLEARVEAIIFASQKPLKVPEILELLADESVTEDDLKFVLDGIVEHYEEREGGFRLVYLKRLGFQFQTTQNAGPIMERMFASRPRPISRAALETLAIIAYRQPVTRAEVEFIRGVDAGSIFRTLMERGLVKCTGRKEVVGRPMLFGTTEEFLKVFNISSIKDLPPLEAFQPSQDTISGAKEKLGAEDSPVDIEKYIADNTQEDQLGGEDEAEDSIEASDADVDAETTADEATMGEDDASATGTDEDMAEELDETTEALAPVLQGAVAAEDDGDWDDEASTGTPERITGATVADIEGEGDELSPQPEDDTIPSEEEDAEEESLLRPEQDAASETEK